MKRNNPRHSDAVPAGKEQNNKPVSKKLSAEHDSDNAGEHKRAYHRGSAKQNKSLKDTSSRTTGESNSYRSGTTKE